MYLCIYSIMYKLRDWVDETKIDDSLSFNERAVEYLENHEHLIDDDYIFLNENAIHIIEKRIQYDVDGNINCNKNAVNFLRNKPQYIRYYKLCIVEHGIEFVDELIKNNKLERIDYQYIVWYNVLFNKNAGKLVKNNLHMIKDWYDICRQPHLIDIIEQNIDKLDWNALSLNYNAIYMLEKNLDKINVDNLRYNKNGFQLLLLLYHNFDNNYYHKNIVFDYFDYCEKNNIPFNLIQHLSEIGYTEKHMEFLKHNNDYYRLSMNPNIFEYDYKRMRETRQSLLWYNDIKK